MQKDNSIKCPSCGHQFDADAAIKSKIEAQVKDQAREYLLKEKAKIDAQKEALNKLKEEEEARVKSLVDEEKRKLKEQLATETKKEFEEELKALQEQNNQKNEALKALKQKELDFLRKERELKDKEEDLKLQLEKEMLEKRQLIEDEVKRKEAERHELRMREYQKQIDDQKKLIEEMKRKSEQGSMQLQGEVQELALEEMLKNSFPFDDIEEVPKGISGADTIQVVKDRMGRVCGKIAYESKRTKAFGGDWIDKLKLDMRAVGADIGLIVTETMPKDMPNFGEMNGVFICSFQEFKGVAYMLRFALVKEAAAKASQENKGDKMQMLYDYLTGSEFKQQVTAIVDGFTTMKDDLNKERRAMEKLWKQREKQLELVISASVDLYGSVKGIAGNAVEDIKSLELGGDNLLEE